MQKWRKRPGRFCLIGVVNVYLGRGWVAELRESISYVHIPLPRKTSIAFFLPLLNISLGHVVFEGYSNEQRYKNEVKNNTDRVQSELMKQNVPEH